MEEQYWLPDVVAMARVISSEEMILDRYRHYLESGREEKYRRSKIYGMNQMEKGTDSWVSHLLHSRKDSDIQGADVVLLAIKQNIAIGSIKLLVAYLTGSAAVFADAMHSVADVLNATYRYAGINLANRDPDYRHPYGYERLRYVFTDRSTLILLGVGGIFPLLHGIEQLYSVPSELGSPWVMGALFVTVGILETPALLRSYSALLKKATKNGISLASYLRHGNDMINITTFAECSLGVIAATAGVIASMQYYLTSDPIYDSIASVVIASTVCLGSGLILGKNAKALVGETLPVDEVEHLVFKLEEDDTVNSVHDVKTEVLGVDTVRFKAEIEFNAEAITRKIKKLYEIPSPASAELLDQVQQLKSEVHVEDWLMKNNADYQTALSSELQRIENMVKKHLKDANFKNFYIDLELW